MKIVLITSICSVILLIIVAVLLCKIYKLSKQYKRIAQDRLRIQTNWSTETKWLKNISEGRKISDFLCNNHYESVAVYGIGYMGKFLLKEIKNDVEVKYIIDKNSAFKSQSGIPIIRPGDIATQSKVDLIIVTAVTFYDEIFDDLIGYGCDMDSIISLEDILCSL